MEKKIMKKQATVDFKKWVVKNKKDDFGAWIKTAKIDDVVFDQLRGQIPEEFLDEFVSCVREYGFTT